MASAQPGVATHPLGGVVDIHLGPLDAVVCSATLGRVAYVEQPQFLDEVAPYTYVYFDLSEDIRWAVLWLIGTTTYPDDKTRTVFQITGTVPYTPAHNGEEWDICETDMYFAGGPYEALLD